MSEKNFLNHINYPIIDDIESGLDSIVIHNTSATSNVKQKTVKHIFKHTDKDHRKIVTSYYQDSLNLAWVPFMMKEIERKRFKTIITHFKYEIDSKNWLLYQQRIFQFGWGGEMNKRSDYVYRHDDFVLVDFEDYHFSKANDSTLSNCTHVEKLVSHIYTCNNYSKDGLLVESSTRQYMKDSLKLVHHTIQSYQYNSKGKKVKYSSSKLNVKSNCWLQDFSIDYKYSGESENYSTIAHDYDYAGRFLGMQRKNYEYTCSGDTSFCTELVEDLSKNSFHNNSRTLTINVPNPTTKTVIYQNWDKNNLNWINRRKVQTITNQNVIIHTAYSWKQENSTWISEKQKDFYGKINNVAIIDEY